MNVCSFKWTFFGFSIIHWPVRMTLLTIVASLRNLTLFNRLTINAMLCIYSTQSTRSRLSNSITAEDAQSENKKHDKKIYIYGKFRKNHLNDDGVFVCMRMKQSFSNKQNNRLNRRLKTLVWLFYLQNRSSC